MKFEHYDFSKDILSDLFKKMTSGWNTSSVLSIAHIWMPPAHFAFCTYCQARRRAELSYPTTPQSFLPGSIFTLLKGFRFSLYSPKVLTYATT